MNRYFDKNQAFNSNSRIFNAYYTNPKASKQSSSVMESLRAKLLAARQSKRVRTALRIAKPIVFTAALVSVLGVAAAIEAGSLGLGSGLALSALLLAVDVFCLCSHRA